jgi:hypothetical protein
MSSGAKVVLAMLGGTLAIALLAIAGFLLTDEGNLRCVEGELQDNPIDAGNVVRSRVEYYTAVEDAEAFVCHRVPHLRELGGLTPGEIKVTRLTNLANLIEGAGAATIEFDYASPRLEQALHVSVFLPEIELPLVEGPHEVVTVQGQAAYYRVTDGDPWYTQVQWSQGGFSYGVTLLDREIDFETLIAILNSIR